MRTTLRANRIVVIDAQNSYSTGLADAVQRLLGAAGINVQRESVNEATVTDFSSLVARIPNDTQVVYTPWQLAAKAQLLGQQLRASGRNATLFGGDGLYSPDDFKIPGSLVTAFPVAANHPVVRAYESRSRRRSERLVRPPELRRGRRRRSCGPEGMRGPAGDEGGGAALRQPDEHPGGAVAARIPGQVPADEAGVLGPGDMRTPAAYIVYRINDSGQYVKVG